MENEYFIKRTQKRWCLLFFITSERLYIKFRARKLCEHFYYAPNILLWGTKFCARKQFCSNNLEGMNSKFLFPRAMENKLAYFENS